jgi:DNA-binding NtrC family response regulator
VITRDQLPPAIRDTPTTTPTTAPDLASAQDADLNLPSTLERIEDELIREALRRATGNKAVAARILGINRTTLVEKLKRRPVE